MSDEIREIRDARLTGERALFHERNLRIFDTIFEDGESPLKECENIEAKRCMFRWKYPLWYGKNISVVDSTLFDMARAGIWYTDHITVENTLIEAPKNFRRVTDLTLANVSFTNAQETLWHCRDVRMQYVTASGDYFAMNSENMEISDLVLAGNYPFDGAKHVTVSHSKLISKDAFWNCEDITVTDSFISGEYLGWNSKNVTFIDCTIESLQGMCYMDHVVMKNCRLLNTTLAFEYSTVDADIHSRIESVKNPSGGSIRAEGIGELIMEADKVDVTKTEIPG
ncbi:MAG: DUF3737 family protein [Lachnospiraceae bacterium]|nr:DUF3737 family protein [Lachnospiraceae bacterium]